MKKNKIVIALISTAFVIGIFSTAYFLVVSRCTLDGGSVCFDKSSETFKIEEDVNLLVQVENEELGKYLVETWDKLHPENRGAIETSVQEPLTIKELSQGFPYDVMVTSQSNASFFLDDLRNLESDLGKIVGSRIPSQLQDAINLQGYYFVQNSIDGWYFVYNETLLEEMGFNLESENIYGLPTELNSWEQILSNSEKILKDADYVFPLTFADQNSFYPFLTGGRWTLNFTNRGSEPGFDSREFHEGLELIEMFRDNKYFDVDEKEEVEDDEKLDEPKETVTTNKPDDSKVTDSTKETDSTNKPDEPKDDEIIENAEDTEDIEDTEDTDRVENKEVLPWLYEKAFYNRETPFSIMHKSLQFEAHKDLTDDVYKIAPFPTFKEHHLAPMGNVNGYIVNKEVTYPSASAEVIRILRTPDALSQYKSSDEKVLVYSRSYFDELDLDDETMRNILAYNYHDTPSVLALDNNPNKLTRSLYDELNFMDIFKDLYQNKISSEEAQERIVNRVNIWLDKNDKLPDEEAAEETLEEDTKENEVLEKEKPLDESSKGESNKDEVKEDATEEIDAKEDESTE